MWKIAILAPRGTTRYAAWRRCPRSYCGTALACTGAQHPPGTMAYAGPPRKMPPVGTVGGVALKLLWPHRARGRACSHRNKPYNGCQCEFTIAGKGPRRVSQSNGVVCYVGAAPACKKWSSDGPPPVNLRAAYWPRRSCGWALCCQKTPSPSTRTKRATARLLVARRLFLKKIIGWQVSGCRCMSNHNGLRCWHR